MINKKTKNIIRDLLRFALGRSLYIQLRFFLTHGYMCNLNNPLSWNEKIQFRKLNVEPKQLSRYVDKYTVRSYVENKIGNEHLIPLIAKFRQISVSDFNKFPDQFVLKTSNGGGGENVRIIYNKNTEDLDELVSTFNRYISESIGSKIDELFYDVEPPYILVEELMLDEYGNLPSDFKCHIFNGDEEKILIQVDKGRFVDHRRSIYDVEGNLQPFSIQPKYKIIEQGYTFPEEFDTLITLAKSLSTDFDYVRVDMYIIGGNVYFGELTFCHGSGWEPVSPREYDNILGSYWKINTEIR